MFLDENKKPSSSSTTIHNNNNDNINNNNNLNNTEINNNITMPYSIQDIEWWSTNNQFKIPSMSEFENSLICPICQNFMENAKFINKCFHFFCNLCICRELQFRNRCPICKIECSKCDLISIPFLNEINEKYKIARRDLIFSLLNSKIVNGQQELNNPFKENYFNQENEVNSSENENNEKLPSICFTLLKNHQLKEYLRKFQLPTQGSRELLIWRIKEYILLYNDNIENKRFSIPQIVQHVIKNEKEREKLKMKRTSKATSNLKDMFATTIKKQKVNSQTSDDNSPNFDEKIINNNVNNNGDVVLISPTTISPLLEEELLFDSFVEKKKEETNINKTKTKEQEKLNQDSNTPSPWRKRWTVKIKPKQKTNSQNSVKNE
ncbi:hypothetical protein ABK040_010359 [Willaertia magna]